MYLDDLEAAVRETFPGTIPSSVLPYHERQGIREHPVREDPQVADVQAREQAPSQLCCSQVTHLRVLYE